MPEQDDETRRKAEAFDRIVKLYRELQEKAQFYSRNWVEMSEALERELARLGGRRGSG